MSWASSVMGAAGGTVQGMGSYAQGFEQHLTYEYNERLTQLQEGEQKVAGDIEQEQLSAKQSSLLSAQEAAYAKANVMASGSALEQMVQSYSDAEFDKQIAAYNNEIKLRALRSQEYELHNAAKMAKTGAVVGLAGGLLGGASSIGGGISKGNFGSPKQGNTIPTYKVQSETMMG